VVQGNLGPRDLVEVWVHVVSLETLETQETLAGMDSLVMLDHKDQRVLWVLQVRKDRLEQSVNLVLLEHQVSVDSRVQMDNEAELEILDKLVTLETLDLLVRQDSKELEVLWDCLETQVAWEILAPLDKQVRL